MKVINIPKLGTVIWDKTLDYPKLLKQITTYETHNEELYDSQQSLLACNARLKRNLSDSETVNKQLYEDNQKLHSQIKRKTNAFYCLGLVLGLNIIYILLH